MRNYILRTTVSALLMFVSVSALAEAKIAFVNAQRAILESEEARRVQTQIAEEFQDEQADIEKLRSEGAALVQRAQKDGEVMSDAEKRKLSNQIREIEKDLQYLAEKLQTKVQERQNELLTGIDVKFNRAVEALVLSEDYDIILPRENAIYVGDLYDITRKVTEKLNETDRAAN
ncbi:MAG TPA: hypothetical protein DCM54_13810 [Gammaproteobacteria bacterium]|nr:hypothetical protein [Gammaproteobacteria bacterium]